MCVSEGHRQIGGGGDPDDDALARIRQVLAHALAHQPPIPPDLALAQIATMLAAARHGLSEEDLELYIRLWWDEQQTGSPP